jgi:hypothetical protein
VPAFSVVIVVASLFGKGVNVGVFQCGVLHKMY